VTAGNIFLAESLREIKSAIIFALALKDGPRNTVCTVKKRSLKSWRLRLGRLPLQTAWESPGEMNLKVFITYDKRESSPMGGCCRKDH